MQHGTKLHKRKLRKQNFLIFLVLTAMEVMIALFVHDSLIRPYVGDILVVVVVYFAVRAVIPIGFRWLPAGVFAFAVMVEGLQYFQLVHALGIEHIAFLKVLLGATFDWKDIGCYAAGCTGLGCYEVLIWKRSWQSPG